MINNPKRILVTAVGGDLGQALVKALSLHEEPIEIFGCDVDATGIGAAFVSSFKVVPSASSGDYVESLDALCQAWGIDAVVPGCEPEIAVLSRLKGPLRLPGGTTIVCQAADWIEAYGDKLSCLRALEGKVALGLYADGDDKSAVKHLVNKVGFPVVVKSRKSSGSKALRIVQNQRELEASLLTIEFPLVQQYLEAEEGEFSAGVFVGRQFDAVIVFKRDLGLVGCSWYAETSEDPDVLEYVREVARATGLRGSANVQVRKSHAGVRLLEINPRFSSLVAARAFCNFKDAEWSVREALGQAVERPSGDFRHVRFRRFFHEMIDAGDGFSVVPEWEPKLLLNETLEED